MSSDSQCQVDIVSSDSPTSRELSGLACRTLWSSTQESGVDEVSEFTGVILHLTSQEKKRVEGSVFGKCKASIIPTSKNTVDKLNKSSRLDL